MESQINNFSVDPVKSVVNNNFVRAGNKDKKFHENSQTDHLTESKKFTSIHGQTNESIEIQDISKKMEEAIDRQLKADEFAGLDQTFQTADDAKSSEQDSQDDEAILDFIETSEGSQKRTQNNQNYSSKNLQNHHVSNQN